MSRKIFNLNKKAIGGRLKSVVASHGITQKEFAERVGFSDKYISDVVQGRTKPSLALLLQIQSVFNVSMAWLVTGTDASPDRVYLESAVKEPPAYYDSTPISEGADESKAEQARPLHPGSAPISEGADKIAIPLLSEAEVLNICKYKTNIRTIKVEEYCHFYRGWLTQPDETLCVRVRGGGMEPVLKEGSIVALNIGVKGPSLSVGRICGILLEGQGIRFRWLKSVEPYLVFVPQQEDYPIFSFPVEKNPIIGRVEGAWVRF
jgi:transcriptional regulator with XRE-family HTH domain